MIIDREKVIGGLEQFIADFKPYCGNESDWQRVYDAIALLKEQESLLKSQKLKVMTLEEIRQYMNNSPC